jgi:hypothetical protein
MFGRKQTASPRGLHRRCRPALTGERNHAASVIPRGFTGRIRSRYASAAHIVQLLVQLCNQLLLVRRQ